MSRSGVEVCAIQLGPLSTDLSKNVERDLRLLRQACRRGETDFVVYPELATTPFWPIGVEGDEFFRWAEKVPGRVTERFSKAAREHGTHVLLPIFEKGDIPGQYFNSVVVIAPSGEIVKGILPDGTAVVTARKNYVSEYTWESGSNNEKLFFAPGPGHPVFKTKFGKVGVLICYERWFTEAWRLLALHGAQLIFVPNASSGHVRDMFVPLLRACAAQNGVFSVGVNKAGTERIENKRATYFGLSSIVNPRGRVLAFASGAQPDVIVRARLNLEEVEKARRSLFIYRDRRPELYRTILDAQLPPSMD